jgi:hypothetical protein
MPVRLPRQLYLVQSVVYYFPETNLERFYPNDGLTQPNGGTA